MEVKVLRDVLEANQNVADDIRARLREHRTLMVNLIGSPGSGKTSLLEMTIAKMMGRFRIAVIEGDVATDLDARRLERFGIPIVLVNTGGACHLESLTIRRALEEFDVRSTDIVFVENVGNLVCPAEFDIGEYAKVAVASVAEGDDKPEKYPLLFHECGVVVLNKIDLAPHCDFSFETFRARVGRLNGSAPLFEVSCRGGVGVGVGLEPWYEWVAGRSAHMLSGQ